MLARAPNMLTEALAYAARGWPVFPCEHKSGEHEKRPLVPRDKDAEGKPIPNTGGLLKATTDENQIRAWWTKWPNALIGVALGHKAGVWVVDFDPRELESVDEVAARMAALVGAFPYGPKSLTQSGGWHIWFKMPAGEVPKNSVGKGQIKHIDWRAQGGYVILPPSVMSNGNAYEWLVSPDVAEFPDAPAELLDLVFRRGRFAPAEKPRAQVETRGVVTDEAKRRYCMVALDRACGRVRDLAQGQRNAEFNNIALGIGHLVAAGGLTRQEAYDGLRGAALSWGISDGDKALKAGGTLDRALDAGMRDPADLSHVGQRTLARRPEPEHDETPHDRETGEVYEPPGMPEQIPHDDDGMRGDDEPPAHDDKLPFRPLGYNRGEYFYFSTNKQQITILKAKEHTTLNLLQLADLNFWGDWIGATGKLTGEHWTQIANSLMAGCHRVGIFVEKYVRGRGAWIDGKTVVVHTGDSARISGEIVPLSDIPGRYIYEKESPWEFEFGAAASTEDAHKLVNVCSRLTWDHPLSGALLAGFNVIAPVCGALTWRPHAWITGPSGSGKSTAVEEICGRIIGPAAERFEGNTSEAGIRQKMGFDARPIILDEAESEDPARIAEMQKILGLARIASSGGSISKGSTSGRAMTFVARSCFLFSSINTALKEHADESRVTKLILTKNTNRDALDHYHNLMRDINAWFTTAYAGAMFSRTVRYLPELLANIETFKVAAAIAFQNRRASDQIGPMLAGFYLCHSTGRIRLEQAEKFIAKHDWSEHAALESATDEMRLFQFLMSQRIRLVAHGAQRDMSIGQCIESAFEPEGFAPFVEALGSRGIRVDTLTGTLAISNTADGIREMLKGKPWVNDWKRPLSMIDGAERTPNTVYFAPGLNTRAVSLPVGLLRGEGR